MPAPLSTSSSTFPPPPAARHYHPTLSIWLSVDPMSDMYPGLSPYVYCANNPVRLVDPDGRDVWEPDKDGNLVAQKNDNAWSLAWYLNTSPEISKKMLEEQGYTIDEKGIRNLKEGDVFKVDYGNVTTRNDDLGYIGNKIREKATKGIAQDLFTIFWKNEVDVELTGAQFAGILLYIKNNPKSVTDKGTCKLKGASGKIYNGSWKEVNLYASSSYGLAYGRATVYTNSSGNIVGFYDQYDFNPQKWGTRIPKDEIKTRLVNYAAKACGVGTSFRINYGYSKRN